MSTEDALEDRDVHAFFKGQTAVAAPFLMVHLTEPVTDFAVFAAFFTDDIVLEVMECIEGESKTRDGMMKTTITLSFGGSLCKLQCRHLEEE